jgi:hypothetical protein
MSMLLETKPHTQKGKRVIKFPPKEGNISTFFFSQEFSLDHYWRVLIMKSAWRSVNWARSSVCPSLFFSLELKQHFNYDILYSNCKMWLLDLWFFISKNAVKCHKTPALNFLSRNKQYILLGVLSGKILWRVNIEDIQINCHPATFLFLVQLIDDVLYEF